MFKTFEDLEVWQLARKFRQEVFSITKKFPKEELYVLTSQLRRAIYSITANIAEGHGRYHYQEEIQSDRIARGSINEALDHLYAAQDAEYIDENTFKKLYDQGRHVEKVLNGYIGYLQNQLEKQK